MLLPVRTIPFICRSAVRSAPAALWTSSVVRRSGVAASCCATPSPRMAAASSPELRSCPATSSRRLAAPAVQPIGLQTHGGHSRAPPAGLQQSPKQQLPAHGPQFGKLRSQAFDVGQHLAGDERLRARVPVLVVGVMDLQVAGLVADSEAQDGVDALQVGMAQKQQPGPERNDQHRGHGPAQVVHHVEQCADNQRHAATRSVPAAGRRASPTAGRWAPPAHGRG